MKCLNLLHICRLIWYQILWGSYKWSKKHLGEERRVDFLGGIPRVTKPILT